MAVRLTATPDGPVQVMPEPPAPRVTVLTPREFMARLTAAEKLAIIAASQTSPPLALWLAELQASTEVDLDHPDTIQGLEAMRLAGLLTAPRVAAIRGNP